MSGLVISRVAVSVRIPEMSVFEEDLWALIGRDLLHASEECAIKSHRARLTLWLSKSVTKF